MPLGMPLGMPFGMALGGGGCCCCGGGGPGAGTEGGRGGAGAESCICLKGKGAERGMAVAWFVCLFVCFRECEIDM